MPSGNSQRATGRWGSRHLRGFPEPARAELIRYFTLAPADEAFVRKFRGQDNVLGAAVQLCTLPWLGFVPDDVAAAPAAVVARLSERLGVPVGALRGYGAREQTRTGHLREIAGYLGWRTVDGPRWKELEEFLFARAMEHDSPKLLFRQACEYLSSSRLMRMRAAWQARREPLPRDHGHLAMMDASMAYLRQFVPDVLAAIRFAGGPGMDDLLQAVTIFAGLYATKARKVPDGAPGGFVPARWAGYLEKAAKDGDVTAYRHYWELCALMALRDGLRSGDVHVPGSRRYADPASFLLTPSSGSRSGWSSVTLATNAVVTWTTEHHGLAVTAPRRTGRDIDDAVLAHIWPTHHENIHFYGTHSVDGDGELAKLDSDGYRPLRAATATEAP